MNKKLILKTNKDGSLNIEADGFTGEACSLDAQKLVDALGASTTETTYKPEMYETEQQTSMY